MIKKYPAVLVVIVLIVPAAWCLSQDFTAKGQISSWGTGITNQNGWNGKIGLRYIPQFNFSVSLKDDDLLNTEVLFNTYYETDFTSSENAFKPYRVIVRYTTAQTETQAGLQKINFGPAQLLRPLMWFDRVDPRDPLKLTNGVYALRYKYSFLDNSLVWLWCLYGNTENKGYELLPTKKNTPEVGGRIQVPLLSGEIAGTYNYREVDAMLYDDREHRYALDGRWDIGIGLWFESVVQRNISNMPVYQWNRMTTIGADYTIPEGSGIYLLAEHMTTAASNLFWNTDQNRQTSALVATYSAGVMDNIMLQEYYDWHNEKLYQYLQFQRNYDTTTIGLSVYHYPENGGGFFLNGNSRATSGYGIQLMLIYNY